VICGDALAAVSQHADGELDAPGDDRLAAHLAGCAECRAFDRHVRDLRAGLRFEPVTGAPDIAGPVLERVRRDAARQIDRAPARRRERRRPLVAAAAAAVAGLVAGATFVGLGSSPPSPAAASVPARVVAAQGTVHSLDASFRLSEAGRPGPGPGRRTFAGRLAYRAPESLALTLSEDRGADGAGASARLVVDRDHWWQRTTRACSPATGLVRCPEVRATATRAVADRVPFSDASPVPLELVTPVDSFALAGTPVDLGTRTVAGRRAVGVRVTAAQVAPLLAGLGAGVDLRPVYPGDPAELWLDDHYLVPLALLVRAADDPGRAPWARSQGVADRPGAPVVRFTVRAAAVNGPVAARAFAAPGGAWAGAGEVRADEGFRSTRGRPTGGPVAAHLPPGFRRYRAGTVTTPGGPGVAVQSWTDGRAWLTVRSTADWPGGHLFGDLGGEVRPVALGGAGRGYASADGRRVALHGPCLDVVVEGSVPAAELQAVAAGLGVRGEPVPAGWAEAATATRRAAATALPGLLVPRGGGGFAAPAVRVDDRTVSQVASGAGDRGFVLVQAPAAHLPPPSDGDEVGVTVRGRPGRYSYGLGQLDWIEGGVARSLRSGTLTLAELVGVADRLEPA
jgi:hypothetical protein